MPITTIDCDYTARPGIAAAYLLTEGERAAFIETNTSRAVPALLAALHAAGLRPEQVEWIIITHVHLDHAGGAGVLLDHCPNATLLAHPKAAVHVIDPSRIVAGATQVYGASLFDALYGEVRPAPAHRVRALDDGATASLGGRELRFLHTRGHANHHFVVHDPAGSAVFTGDAFGILYPRLQRNGLFAFPSSTPTDFDAEAAHASVDRIVATGASSAFPTHFGEHHDLPAIAAQLHPMLDAHAAIVQTAEREGWEEHELDPRCQAAVAGLFEAALVRHGLASDAEARAIVAFDIDLNAQGLAFAVRKLRFKRG
jgi:glyoxylase-like metal-dependent hydrolase (beta-lactamase superfamily II)